MISIVFPVYNKADELETTIEAIEAILVSSGMQNNFEMILVNDGSSDNTANIIDLLCNKKSYVRNFSFDRNLGKGAAIVHGLNQVSSISKVIGFMDADLDIDPKDLPSILGKLQLSEQMMIIGSKYHSLSKVKVSNSRKFLSHLYRYATRQIIGISVSDAQTGLKFYTSDFHPILLKHSFQIKSFAFDVELIALAEKNGLNIVEYPISVRKTFSSSVGLKSGGKALWDLIRIRQLLRFSGNNQRND